MRQANILVAEDESELRLSMSLWLRSMGHSVTVAADGVEALKALVKMESEGAVCDLLICDIQMPSMGGEALIETMKKRNVEVPVLAVSGYGDKSLVIRLMRQGCDDFIDKPFGPDVLSSHVQRILDESAKKKLGNRNPSLRENHVERAGQIVHDIHNLLGIAVGYTGMAMDDLDGMHDIRAKLSTAAVSSKRASEISDQFLLLISAAATDKVRTNLNILVHRAAALFREILPSNIALLSAIPSTHLWVNGDAERIQQALLNLGLNALDAMSEGGRLSIALVYDDEPSALDAEENRRPPNFGNCTVSVSDTGKGIDPSILGRIFEKGFTTKSKGNGIGLHAVRQIAEEHDGEITVANNEGGGARFELKLPLIDVQPMTISTLSYAPESILSN